MNALLLTPVVLSLLVLGAHFLRGGEIPLVVASLAVLVLLGIRKPWAARLAQVALVLGALEWVITLVRLANIRAQMGMPGTRMAIILGVVAAITLGSALLFQTRRLSRFYRLGEKEPGSES